MLLLGEEGKNTPRIHMILQMTMNSQGIPKKEKKAEGTTKLDFKLQCIATVAKTDLNWQKKKPRSPKDKITELWSTIFD